MPNRLAAGVAVGMTTLMAFVSCSDALGPVNEVRGTYAGTWRFTVESTTTGRDTTFHCPGQVTLLASKDGATTFTGSYLIRAASNCQRGSPISGTVSDGNYRPTEGGLDFKVQVPGARETIFQDVFPGAGLEFSRESGLLSGECTITQADSRMVGALETGFLDVEISALTNCTIRLTTEEGQAVEVEDTQIITIRFQGSR